MTTKASFIIPAKDEENTIKYCLESIRNQHIEQNETKIEIIVVDNNSSDNTDRIARSYGAIIIKKKEGNIAALRNAGAKAARGEFLCFTDADCVLPYNWLSTCLSHIGDDKDICAVTSPEKWFSPNPSWVERSWCKLKHKNTGSLEFVSWCSTQAVCIRRDAFNNIGGFNEKLATCEDADLGYRLSKYCKILLDHSISHKHIRGSKTIYELFKRERWRGSSNIQGIYSHGLQIGEIPSIAAPLLFGSAIITTIILFATDIIYKENRNDTILYTSLFTTFIIPTLMTLKKLRPKDLIYYFIPCYIVSFIYLSARFLSLFSRTKNNKARGQTCK